jgi:hypothetical protein
VSDKLWKYLSLNIELYYSPIIIKIYIFYQGKSIIPVSCRITINKNRLKFADILSKTSLPRRAVQYALKTLTKQEFRQVLGKGTGSQYQLLFLSKLF